LIDRWIDRHRAHVRRMGAGRSGDARESERRERREEGKERERERAAKLSS
jgi:hypothetical protein